MCSSSLYVVFVANYKKVKCGKFAKRVWQMEKKNSALVLNKTPLIFPTSMTFFTSLVFYGHLDVWRQPSLLQTYKHRFLIRRRIKFPWGNSHRLSEIFQMFKSLKHHSFGCYLDSTISIRNDIYIVLSHHLVAMISHRTWRHS